MITDPMELMIAEALDEAGEPYETGPPHRLDFYLPLRGVFVEVKQMHSPRIAAQMSTQPNVIVAQGAVAVRLLADLLRRLPPVIDTEA